MHYNGIIGIQSGQRGADRRATLTVQGLATQIKPCPHPLLYLDLSISSVREILHFQQERKGRYKRTDKNTHIEARSPLAIRHHQNWRAKSLELQERMNSNDLAFTAPLSGSKKHLQKIRAMLLDVISEIAKTVEVSPEEEVVYLAIDWIKM